MKHNYFFTLLALVMGWLCGTPVMADGIDWCGEYTIVAQYEDVANGSKMVDETLKMTIGKVGNDLLVTQLGEYTEIIYDGLLTGVDASDATKLNIYADNIKMISTDDERGQGIYKYVSLRDVDGGKSNTVLQSLGNGKFSLTPFALVETRRASTEQTILRRYTNIISVTTAGAQEEPMTDWACIYKLPSCYAFHIDQKTGTFLASDFRDACDGGIYYSDDKGVTWTKTKVADHNYGKFVETGEYVMALGYGGRIARSDDGGHTWELLSYRRAIEGIVAEEDMDYTAAYDMVVIGNRLYVADYAGGVIYSDDQGETWKHTSDDIFLEESEGKQGKETIHNVLYGITEQNGHILAIGLYCVYEYNADNDTWKIVRTDSNLMAIHCHHKGVLYCGRAMPNEGYRNRFLEVTEDGENWYPCGHPDSEDNNVRALGSNDQLLVVGLQSTGILYTDDDCDTWYEMETEGLPLRYPGNAALTDQKLTPLSIEFDKDYVYVAFFSDNPNTEAGVWRYPLNKCTNAVISIDEPVRQTGIYDLLGRRVSRPTRGIYVVNGKKVLK